MNQILLDLASIAEEDRSKVGSVAKRLGKHINGEPKVPVIVDSEEVSIPTPALELLVEVLDQVSKGNAVKVEPVYGELTPYQVAEILNLSQTQVLELFDKGSIPYRKVGSMKIARLTDVLKYKEREYEKRQKAVNELSQEWAQLSDLVEIG